MSPKTVTKSGKGMKTGADGLTKSQRYYQKLSHQEEVREKNRTRERERRERLKEAKAVIATADPTLDVNAQKPVTTESILDANAPESSVNSEPGVAEASSLPANIQHPTRSAGYVTLDASDIRPWVTASLTDHSRPRIIFLETDTALQRLQALREKVIYWTSGWGGLLVWPETLNLSLTNAVNDDETERWTKEVLRHAASGRRLLVNLQEIEGNLPEEDWKVKELWRISFELVQMLVKGITIMEGRISLIPHLEPGDRAESDVEPTPLSGMEDILHYTSEDDEDWLIR